MLCAAAHLCCTAAVNAVQPQAAGSPGKVCCIADPWNSCTCNDGFHDVKDKPPKVGHSSYPVFQKKVSNYGAIKCKLWWSQASWFSLFSALPSSSIRAQLPLAFGCRCELPFVLRPLPAEKSIYSYKTNKQINDTGFQYLRNLLLDSSSIQKTK